ncbi:MAG: response regulator [Gloeomargaritaceae cyanobacterium C42_A2020_066]|nr:response regulator [Gloeomargaritaceae cyanobacterium C42_A2020_066]
MTQRHKVVVIDDSRVIRMRVRDMLPQGNLELLEAKDGVEGLQLVRSERPGLVLLDFLLPRMSGWEVFQQIQQDPQLHSIPLVIMSGRKEEVTEKLPEPFEYFEFVSKPFEQQQLFEAIKLAMAKAKKRVAHLEASGGATRPPTEAYIPGQLGPLEDRIKNLEAEVAGLRQEIEMIRKFLGERMG